MVQGRRTPSASTAPAEAFRMTRTMSQGTPATRENLEALEALYQRWSRDPNSVDESWRYFFQGFELGLARPVAAAAAADGRSHTEFTRLVYRYRELGHFLARLDPLNDPRPSYPLLELSEVGFSVADLDRPLEIDNFFVGLRRATLRELLAALRETYCRTIGVEYMHIQDTRIRRWLQERMEP